MIITRRRLDTEALWKRHSELPSCTHPNKEARKRIIKGGNVIFQEQCPSCGEKFGGALSKDRFTAQQIGKMADWDEHLQTSFQKKKSERWNQLKAEEEQRILDEWRAAHAAYIESPAWRKKRDAVIKRAKAMCEGCGEKKASEVHHLNYDHLGEEFLFELVAVCSECHERYHADPQTSVASQSVAIEIHEEKDLEDDEDCPF